MVLYKLDENRLNGLSTCLQRVLRFKFWIKFAPEDKRGLEVTSSKGFRLRFLELNLWPGEDPSKSFFLQLLKREDDSAFN